MKYFLLPFLLSMTFTVLALPPQISDFIKVDQFGYRPDAVKVAVISDPQVGFNAAESFNPGNVYQLREWATDMVVFSDQITAWNNGATHDQSGDKAWWFDFTSFTTPGSYYVYDPARQVGSGRFEIADNVYNEVLRAVSKMFYFQRCGLPKNSPFALDWHDATACHVSPQDLDCRLVTNPTAATSRDLSGGWHDAGDYNKYVNFTYPVLHDLLFAYQQHSAIWSDNIGIPESYNGIPDLLDEVKVELDWLLKMQLNDGSCLMKVSVLNFEAESPPSADLAPRFYGEAQASATRVIASIFAHAALVYGSLGDPAMDVYADTLEARALSAWHWTSLHPAPSSYSNTGFASANPEMSHEEQEEVRIGAAAMLFALTGNTSYRDTFDAYYTTIRPYQWTYWYPFQTTIEDIMLFYRNLPNATAAVAGNIESNCIAAVTSNNPDLLPAWVNNTDAYRAHLGTNDYVWGSNQWRTNMGNILHNMYYYQLDPTNSAQYLAASESYIHAMHGVNPLNFVMLTHMDDAGAEKSARQMYHSWFGFGTPYSHADSSLIGPAPGYVTGGCNPNYAPDPSYCCIISPPQNQPVQKSYKDWNVSYPQNSWEVTEPAIYYQSAYLKLLSKFLDANAPLPVSLEQFEAVLTEEGDVRLRWTASGEQISGYRVERRRYVTAFTGIGWQQGKRGQESQHYTFTDHSPTYGINYYRLQMHQLDGSKSYSKVVAVEVPGTLTVSLFPNPVSGALKLHVEGQKNSSTVDVRVWNLQGKLVYQQAWQAFGSQQPTSIEVSSWPPSLYLAEVLVDGQCLKRRFLVH